MSTTHRSLVANLGRPQLVEDAPVLLRAHHQWQVGLDPERAVLLECRDAARLLGWLDGRRPIAQVRNLAVRSGMAAGEFETVLSALAGAGLLRDGSDAAPGPPDGGARIRLIGAGRLGRAVAAALVEADVGRLHIFDDQPADPELDPGSHATRAAAACRALSGRSRTEVGALSHWSKPEGAELDLTVVAVDEVEVDRVITEHLLRADQAHLLVRTTGRSIVVGPLVVPGRTSCVRCADLHRADRDPAWPTVLAQLTRVVLPTPRALLPWAAGVASVQIRAHLRGFRPETASATVEVGEDDQLVRRREWPAHAACGCSWSPPPEWGA